MSYLFFWSVCLSVLHFVFLKICTFFFFFCRVRELEGKIRELEGSMARMGAQHDVNMELIDTFRHQKETVSLLLKVLLSYKY